MFARPRSRLLVHPLGPWISQSHQSCSWYCSEGCQTVYHKHGNVYVRYTDDRPVRMHTRSGSQRCTRRGVIIGTSDEQLFRCTVYTRSNDCIILQSVSRQDHTLLPHFTAPPLKNNFDPYFDFRFYSDNDDGIILS